MKSAMVEYAKTFVKEQLAEDIADATAFFVRNWVEGLSRSSGGLGKQIQVQWVL